MSACRYAAAPRPTAGVTVTLFIVTLAVALSGVTPAAAVTKAPPKSFTESVADLSTVARTAMPPVDEAALVEEDEDRYATGWDGPFRFAAPHFVNIDFLTEATPELVNDGGTMWRLRVVSEGARTINIGIAGFELPVGATFHMYPSDLHTYVGPFGSADHIAEREFWSPVIPGDQIVLELYVPADAAFTPTLEIIQVNHDYIGFGDIDSDPDGHMMQGWCNNDVVCPEGDPWRDEIRSEGVYTINGSWMCSGQMLNSVAETPPPYFLTADHCGISGGNDHAVRIYWNFESPDCGDLCCGSLSDSQQGTIFRADYSTSDFCLVELSQDPDPDFDVYYSGWDAREENAPQRCTAIHHPNTDEKAISFNYDPITVTSYLSNSVPGNGSHWRVDDWEDGTTEPGSSGSGIWDENHHLVGQLHGGYASCSSITSDWYGRFSVSWDDGSNQSSRLRDWLDPDNTGTRVLDGRDPDDPLAVDGDQAVPGAATLLAVNPNPFSRSTEIRFELTSAGNVAVTIHDVAGRIVSSVPAKSYGAGESRVSWDGNDANGMPLPAGVYFVRLAVGERSVGTTKIVMMR